MMDIFVVVLVVCVVWFFFFKQKTAYEMRISDWSSDVCSSDLQSGVVKGRAFDRVLLKLPPSKQGKNSAEDCVIFETYLDVVGALRASGLQAAVVFLSSNKAEYQAPEISVELARLGTTYVPNMRSEERRVGKECVSTCRSRWSRYH